MLARNTIVQRFKTIFEDVTTKLRVRIIESNKTKTIPVDISISAVFGRYPLSFTEVSPPKPAMINYLLGDNNIHTIFRHQ